MFILKKIYFDIDSKCFKEKDNWELIKVRLSIDHKKNLILLKVIYFKLMTFSK